MLASHPCCEFCDFVAHPPAGKPASQPAMDISHAPTETRDLVFRKIGDDISLTLESPAFIDSIPARALAVSNRFGLTFFVHANGINLLLLHCFSPGKLARFCSLCTVVGL